MRKILILMTTISMVLTTILCPIFVSAATVNNTTTKTTTQVKKATEPETHIVTFMYGTKTEKIEVDDGDTVIPPDDTFVPGYVFVGWTDSLKKIKSDKVICGIYNKTTGMVANPLMTKAYVTSISTYSYASGKKYTNNLSAGWPVSWKTKYEDLLVGEEGKTCAVHWYNGLTGELWKTDLVEYGTSLAGPINDPCVNGYTFVGWDGSWQNITEDRCISAQFIMQHKVTFIDSLTGAQFLTLYVDHGATVDKPIPPEHSGMQFAYYSGNTEDIQADCFVYAYYKTAN